MKIDLDMWKTQPDSSRVILRREGNVIMATTVTMTEILIPVTRLREIVDFNCYCGEPAGHALVMLVAGGIYECSVYCDEHVPVLQAS